MSVEDHLQPGEEILYRAYTSRVTLAPYYALLALALGAAAVAWVWAVSVPGPIVAWISVGSSTCPQWAQTVCWVTPVPHTEWV